MAERASRHGAGSWSPTLLASTRPPFLKPLAARPAAFFAFLPSPAAWTASTAAHAAAKRLVDAFGRVWPAHAGIARPLLQRHCNASSPASDSHSTTLTTNDAAPWFPNVSTAVAVTVYVPAAAKTWSTVSPLAAGVPSPKLQLGLPDTALHRSAKAAEKVAATPAMSPLGIVDEASTGPPPSKATARSTPAVDQVVTTLPPRSDRTRSTLPNAESCSRSRNASGVGAPAGQRDASMSRTVSPSSWASHTASASDPRKAIPPLP